MEIISSNPLKWLLKKIKKITSVGEDLEKLEPSLIAASGNLKWYSSFRRGRGNEV